MGINLEAPEEGPSTGRFHDCEPSDGPSFEALVCARPNCAPRPHCVYISGVRQPVSARKVTVYHTTALTGSIT